MQPLKDPNNYNNRELSWLQFNTRVLKLAQDESLPPLERLKYLAIYGTNLDEFYMIRVAGLKKLFNVGIIVSGADRLTPLQQLKEIRLYLHQELQVVEYTLGAIFKALQKEQIYFKQYHELNSHEKHACSKLFDEQIYPVIVPIAVDATHPFPHLNNLSFGQIVRLLDIDDPSIVRYGFIRIPRVIPRFFEINDAVFIPVESIVEQYIEQLFPGFKLDSIATFRVTRNADIAIEEEEADDFMEILEEGLKLRRKGEFVRLELSQEVDSDLLSFFNRHANIFKEDIYYHHEIINLGALWEIVGKKSFAPHLLPSFKPKILPPLDKNESIYSILDKEDIILFHPYESFEPVVNLINTAAKDPDVVSIKITLYRTGSNSPVVKALIEAAESKQVTAMVELKARFDEENNLIWAKALENAGAHVTYGISGFKVHAKALLITKKVGNKLRQYAHLSTGNYNPITAKIYTDCSFLTSDEEITKDLTKFFHFLTGFSKKGKLDRLYMAPTQIKPKIISLIQNESRKGKEGHIIAKINSLVDDDVIRALYKASNEGVKIELIVRGICCLKPGLPGVSENIRVISIIGKYLEHSRIFYFKHASPTIYISSADWMPRNLIRRVELLIGIRQETAQEKILDYLKLQMLDNVNAHELLENGTYVKVKPKENEELICTQTLYEAHTNKLYKATQKERSTYVNVLASRLMKES